MMTAVTGSVLVPVALFLFVYNATPEALPYESYVMTAFPQLTTWQLGLRSFLTSLGSLVGVLLYWRLFTQVPLHARPAGPPYGNRCRQARIELKRHDSLIGWCVLQVRNNIHEHTLPHAVDRDPKTSCGVP
jgi:hypothetical protein